MIQVLRIALASAIVATMLCAGYAHAQVLAAQNPATATMEVSQFGMPRDAKFVFCSSDECPERSLKHMATPPQQKATAPLPVRPQVQSETLIRQPGPTETSNSAARTESPPVAKVKPPGKPLNRKVRPKPKTDIECKPPPKS